MLVASLLGPKVHQARRDHKAIRVLPGPQALKGSKAPRVKSARKVRRVHKVHVVIRDPLELRVRKDCRASRVQLVRKAHRVLRGQPDRWDQLDLGW